MLISMSCGAKVCGMDAVKVVSDHHPPRPSGLPRLKPSIGSHSSSKQASSQLHHPLRLINSPSTSSSLPSPCSPSPCSSLAPSRKSHDYHPSKRTTPQPHPVPPSSLHPAQIPRPRPRSVVPRLVKQWFENHLSHSPPTPSMPAIPHPPPGSLALNPSMTTPIPPPPLKQSSVSAIATISSQIAKSPLVTFSTHLPSKPTTSHTLNTTYTPTTTITTSLKPSRSLPRGTRPKSHKVLQRAHSNSTPSAKRSLSKPSLESKFSIRRKPPPIFELDPETTNTIPIAPTIHNVSASNPSVSSLPPLPSSPISCSYQDQNQNKKMTVNDKSTLDTTLIPRSHDCDYVKSLMTTTPGSTPIIQHTPRSNSHSPKGNLRSSFKSMGLLMGQYPSLSPQKSHQLNLGLRIEPDLTMTFNPSSLSFPDPSQPYSRSRFDTSVGSDHSFDPPSPISSHPVASSRSLTHYSCVSTFTLASTYLDAHDDATTSDLASIGLPTSPVESFQPSMESFDLISDFPLPPSHNSFLHQPHLMLPISSSALGRHTTPLSLNFTESHLSHSSAFSSPSSPPQVPLPPLPTCPQQDDAVSERVTPNLSLIWKSHSSLRKIPVQSQADTLAWTRTLKSPASLNNEGETPHNLDEFLDLYIYQQASPSEHPRSSPRESTRRSSSNVRCVDRDAKISSDALIKSTTSSCIDITSLEFVNLLEGDLPNPTSDFIDMSPEHVDDQAEDRSVMKNRDSFDFLLGRFSSSCSDADEESSEIDLTEPLDMMAVRLGYQLDLDEDLESDDSADRRLNDQFDDEEEHLPENLSSLPMRAPSQLSIRPPSSYSGMNLNGSARCPSVLRSHSSLRSPYSQFRGRHARVVIAEASSSDEEEFDLSLDHRTSRRHMSPTSESCHIDLGRRSSPGSPGTDRSVATRLSSGRSSCDRTLEMTPNTTRSSTELSSLKGDQAMEGLVGLGFEIQAVENESNPERFSPPGGSPRESPGKPCLMERRDWLHGSFDRDRLTASPSRSSSFPGPTKNELDAVAKVAASEQEHEAERTAPINSASPIDINPLGEHHLMPVMIEEEERSAFEAPFTSGARRISTGVRLKPLLLVNQRRKQRVTSFPVINSTIREVGSYEETSRRKSYLLVMTDSARISNLGGVGGRTMMNNEMNSHPGLGEKWGRGASSLRELQTASSSLHRLHFAGRPGIRRPSLGDLRINHSPATLPFPRSLLSNTRVPTPHDLHPIPSRVLPTRGLANLSYRSSAPPPVSRLSLLN